MRTRTIMRYSIFPNMEVGYKIIISCFSNNGEQLQLKLCVGGSRVGGREGGLGGGPGHHRGVYLCEGGQSQLELPPVLGVFGDGVAMEVDGLDGGCWLELVHIGPLIQTIVVELGGGGRGGLTLRYS